MRVTQTDRQTDRGGGRVGSNESEKEKKKMDLHDFRDFQYVVHETAHIRVQKFIIYHGYWDPSALDVGNWRLLWKERERKECASQRKGLNCVVNTVIV